MYLYCFFFQAEDGIRYLVRSRGLGDVYKRQQLHIYSGNFDYYEKEKAIRIEMQQKAYENQQDYICLLYTSDAADERSSVDLGGRRIIKKKTQEADKDLPQT